MSNSNIFEQYKNFSPKIGGVSIFCIDIWSFLFSFVLSHSLFQKLGETNPDFMSWIVSVPGRSRVWIFISLSAASMLWFWGQLRHYKYRKPFWNELKDICIVVLFMAIADLSIAGLAKWELSRVYWFSLWVITFFSIVFFRLLVKKVLLKLKFWQWPCVIIGSGGNARDAFMALSSEPLMGFNVLSFLSLNEKCSDSSINDIPVLNCDYIELINKYTNLKIFIALEYDEIVLRDEIIRKLTHNKHQYVSVVPTIRGLPLYGTDVSHFLSHEVLLLRIRNNLSRFSAQFIKRVFDIVISTLLILFLSPVLAYIAWSVSKDGGDAIYGHERVGYKGRKFKCLKFRSMIINSQVVLQNLLDSDPEARAEWEKDFKLKKDPRITKIGAFLRKTSLDELPQLWNVIKGEMSLVGPRPVVEAELERYGDDVDYYFMAKPGMTGLWQVSGRNDTDYATRVYLDAWYAKNWSLWYDIAILFKTVNVVLRRDGAY